MSTPTVEQDREALMARLSYDPETGVFTWLQKPETDRWSRTWNTRYAGKEAGASSHGYVSINIDGRLYLAHRLAWLFVCEEWPAVQIDHINGDRCDNRIANLRAATVRQNSWNAKRPAHNTSGFKGVRFHKRDKRYEAFIRVNGVAKALGYFATVEEAAQAYEAAARSHFGEFARTA